jgi:S1-C subfamily serine protease
MAYFLRVSASGWVLFATLFALTTLGEARAPAEEPPEKLQQKVLKASAWVFLPKGPPGPTKWEFEAASGCLVDVKRRLVITSNHVVKKKTKVTVFFPQQLDDKLVTERLTYIKQAADGGGITGEVVATNVKTDLALIRLESLPEGATALELAKKSVAPNTRIHSLGNPTASTELWRFASWKVQGVSPLRVQVKDDLLDTLFVYTYPFEKLTDHWGPGASGGPVVNDDGEIVGITQGMIMLKQKNCGSFIDVTVVQDFLKKNQKPLEK